MNRDFKLLVVDDTPELLDIAIKTLKKADYQVFSAVDGADCMNAIRRVKPDIILLDVMLPDINGQELAKKIKNDPQYHSIFVILLSSLKTSSEHISEGLEEGADGYIVRPVSNRELLARINAACRLINAERKTITVLSKFQSLFSSMQEGVYLHEMVYNEHGEAINYRITEANPASEKHLAIKPEMAVGKLATELYETEQPPLLETYAKVSETGNPFTFEQYFEPLKKQFLISVFSPEKGKFATIFSDVSERKKADAELRLKNKELEKVNAEKDKFFSIIAHDLKSPFNAILGFSELLIEQVHKNDCTEVGKYAKIILQSSHRAMDLLMNLFEWTQSQTGRLEFKPENFSLNELLDEISFIFNEIAEKKSIIIEKDLPPDMNIYADERMMGTIFRNLVSNAIKFTMPNGVVKIHAQQQKDKLFLSVSDTGVGIPKKVISKLFQIDNEYSTIGTDHEKGTGLGLVLCREFIEKHNGKIWVESEEGKGSAFYLSIPALDH